MYTGRSCWLCGRNGTAEPLDKHHIFGGAYRKKSEKYGLTVYLCHGSCHIFGEKAVHSCRETMDELAPLRPEDGHGADGLDEGGLHAGVRQELSG